MGDDTIWSVKAEICHLALVTKCTHTTVAKEMVYEREREREREIGCWNICLPCTASNNSSLVHRELILFGGCETKKENYSPPRSQAQRKSVTRKDGTQQPRHMEKEEERERLRERERERERVGVWVCVRNTI